MKRDREINATCMYLGSFCLAYMCLALLRLIANYAFTTKNSKGLVRYATLVSMWLFGFASTLMVVFFIAYCAILACWILVAAVRNGVGIESAQSRKRNHSRRWRRAPEVRCPRRS